MANDKVQLFEEQPIRTAWVEDEEEWYFSVVDVVGTLTEQIDYEKARKYWNKLKQRLKEEGSQLVTNCHQLKMTAQDGKKRLTDVANTEQLLRIIQSVPSKKAEPFKMWLAHQQSKSTTLLHLQPMPFLLVDLQTTVYYPLCFPPYLPYAIYFLCEFFTLF